MACLPSIINVIFTSNTPLSLNQASPLLFNCQCSISGYMLEVCHIPCPLDCKLSDWSPWSACSASCGSGLRMRSKWLREKAFNGGRPCPRLDLKNQVRYTQAIAYFTASWTVPLWNTLWKVNADAHVACLSLKWK